jgi:peptide/nickel transport system permease protein
VRVLAGRALQAASVLFGISILVFLIFFATPGADPASRMAGRGASPETLAAVRAEYGLDRPLPVQYVHLMRRLFVTRDLASFVNRGQLVVPAVLDAAPVTLLLAVGAAVLWLAAGLVIGLVAAAFGGAADRVVVVAGLIGVSVPAFWLGEVVNLLTQRTLHGTWELGWVPPLGVGLSFAGMVFPCTTLALLYAGVYGRVLRAGLLDALAQDHVRTARAKGASERRVLVHHALRLSLVPLVALFGLDFGSLLGGGTLLTEVVFGLHGIGKLTYDALQTLDLPMIMATVMYAAMLVVLVNAVADAAVWAIDPRRRDATGGM